MSTRLSLRASVRARLEDTGGSPLFADADLNSFLADAVQEYGQHAPLRGLATAVVALDATQLSLPAGVPNLGTYRVRDGAGNDVRRQAARYGFGPAESTFTEQSWRENAGVIYLQRKVGSSEAGTWSLDYRRDRVLVADDVTAQPIEPGDEAVIVELVVARVYERRLFEDAKRGVRNSDLRVLVERSRKRADDMMRDGSRRARQGWLDVA